MQKITPRLSEQRARMFAVARSRMRRDHPMRRRTDGGVNWRAVGVVTLLTVYSATVGAVVMSLFIRWVT